MGLETALGIAMVELVERRALTLPQLVRCLTSRPAEIAHLPGGTLKPGAPADLVIFDAEAVWTVDPAAFFSRSRNTPFAGRRLKGRVRWTFVGGTAVHHMETESRLSSRGGR